MTTIHGFGITHGLLKTVQSVDAGTSFKQGFCLGQTKATSSARDTNDLSSQAELGQSVAAGDGWCYLLLDGHHRGGSGFNKDRHCCSVLVCSGFDDVKECAGYRVVQMYT